MKDMIQAKSDKNLIDLSSDNLDFEVSQPKKCLSEHGIDLSLLLPLQFVTEMQYYILL